MNEKLKENGYIYVDDFFKGAACDEIISAFGEADSAHLPTAPVGLNDSNDLLNVVYNSKRSPMRYCYLSTPRTQDLNNLGSEMLAELTGLEWQGNINSVCFPIFEYKLGGYIEPHRGRNVGFGRNDYVAVLMLTAHGLDYLGGEFFLNTHASASDDGKQIFNEDESRRIHFTHSKGSILIFDNRIHVHGTLPVVAASNGNAVRMTTSWRMQE